MLWWIMGLIGALFTAAIGNAYVQLSSDIRSIQADIRILQEGRVTGINRNADQDHTIEAIQRHLEFQDRTFIDHDRQLAELNAYVKPQTSPRRWNPQ